MYEFTKVDNFNPRPPHGERLCSFFQFIPSSHISIHAPRMGSDMDEGARTTSWKYFNPRPPHGERRGFYRRPKGSTRNFNPRPPHGERPRAEASNVLQDTFQSTPPAWGATFFGIPTGVPGIFQSTPPAWGATIISLR